MSDHFSDPMLNCILAVCCPEGRATEELAEALVRDGICEHRGHGHQVAAYLCEHFDLAPKGSLVQLKADLARIAKA